MLLSGPSANARSPRVTLPNGTHTLHRTLWGKADQTSNAYHPLICHMLDVAAVARALQPRFIHPSLVPDVGLDPEDWTRLFTFWIALHDLGKASPGFQAKVAFLRQELEQSGLSFKRYHEDRHGVIGVRAIHELLPELPGAGQLPAPAAYHMAKAVAGHHGAFPTDLDIQRITARDLGSTPWDTCRRALVEDLVDVLNPPALECSLLKDDASLAAFWTALAGYTSVADWIGSDRDFFPYAEPDVDLRGYWEGLSGNVGRVLQHLRWPDHYAPQATRPFNSTFPFPPRPLQDLCDQEAPSLREPALVLIEAPMGEGKTEAALRIAQHLIDRERAVGLYFALPTQASSNQIFGRVGSFLDDAWPDSQKQFHLLHGGAALQEDYGQLIASSINGPLEEHNNGVVASTWFQPKKRGLLAPFAVGTVDQALLAALQTKHWFVRMAGLSRRVVIIDEVHAYDTYMSTLLDRLLAWLRAMRCSVVLLSATLPEARRRELLTVWNRAAISRSNQPRYPRVTFVTTDNSQVMATDSTVRHPLRIRHAPAPELERELLKKGSEGAVCAYIVNTVASAQQTFRRLQKQCQEAGIELLLLHARFPAGLRRAREADAISRLGKDGSRRPRRCIVVSTQVIEQSLDLDFDWIVSDWAPIDLLLQRSGRLHRHRQSRPPGCETAELAILEPDVQRVPSFGASEHVYARYVLLRTYEVLRDVQEAALPQDVPYLIERVYADDVPASTSGAFQAALQDARAELEQHRRRQDQKAREVAITDPEHEDAPFLGNEELEEEDPKLHERLQARTRDMQPTVQLVCLHERKDGRLTTDRRGDHAVDPRQVEDRKAVANLVESAVSISHRGVVAYLRDADGQAPPAWQRCPALRYTKLAVLQNGRCCFGHWLLTLDEDLGLEISRR